MRSRGRKGLHGNGLGTVLAPVGSGASERCGMRSLKQLAFGDTWCHSAGGGDAAWWI